MRVPFEYGHDALFHGMMIKGMMDHGWYLRNESLGSPGEMELYDFPQADNLHMVVIKGLTLFTSNYALALNLYFLLTFPLTTILSFYVFRHFNLSFWPSLCASLLYTFLPFHFLRNEHHLFLASYYLIPLLILVVLWVSLGKSLWKQTPDTRGKIRFAGFRSIFSIVVCILIGSSGVYFPFFSCFILLIAGVSAAVSQKSLGHLLASVILIAVISLVLFANLSPSIVYRQRLGSTDVAERSPAEAETYGLKMVQLLLPISGHRLEMLAKLKARYNSAPFVNENDNASLGLVGSIGFLFLLGWFLYRKPVAAKMSAGPRMLLNHLSLLNVAAVLFGTIGGFGSLFALIVSPRIRTYNRISIFIAFFCLFAVAIGLESLVLRFAKSRTSRIVFVGFVAIIVLLGVLDQTGTYNTYSPNYAENKRQHDSDRDFVGLIETSLPPGAALFQLPYVTFPEQGTVNKMLDYSHFRGYLNSHSLRWSYGTMKGRQGDLWQKAVSSQPPGDFLETLILAGFNGVYLDRDGYADQGAEVEAQLSKILRGQPLVSRLGNLAFFNLSEYKKQLMASYTPEELEARRQFALHPLITQWGGGCYELEKVTTNDWHWCSSQGELRIRNDSDQTRRVKLEMTFATGYDDLSTLYIESTSFSQTLKVNRNNQFFSKEVLVPPGALTIKFTCDAARVNAPGDTRFLVFKIDNFRLRPPA